ncbi:uncharacterized protein LOC110817891 [Carica papaya]|uniref:uncharacterized protein LOC110817891 n=1 Tax=Carica papaya TaxID=3649 RepID=UPI000B8CF4E0|nr:uncharacterized protein LOC110817891 [Carica papaya]
MDEYGCGFGSIMLMLIVVVLVFFAPLGMGPLQPPSYSLLIVFPVILVAILIFLSYASK